MIIPIGYKVSFNLNGQVLEGVITKIMAPGYVFKHMPGSEGRLRYGIQINNSKNNCVIFEDQLLDPDYNRICNDEDYRNKVKSTFELKCNKIDN